jgi:putative phosphoesterase
MRTLVISDIHGNIDALKAITEPCDKIICIGDIVDYGPSPKECIEFLQARELVRARGNHDHAVAFCQDCQTPKGPLRQLSLSSRQYTMDVLDNADKEWLGEAETDAWAEHEGLLVYAVHGAPSNHMYRYLTPDTPDDVLSQEAALVEADIICVGHTHKPFIREVDHKLFVNVGSVGQPRDGIPEASYAVIEDGEVELRRTEYDIEAAVGKTSALPLKEAVIDQLVYILRKAKTPRQV